MATLQGIVLAVGEVVIGCGIYYWIYSGFRKEHVKKYGEEETKRVVERDTGWNGNLIDYLRSIICFFLILLGIQYLIDFLII